MAGKKSSFETSTVLEDTGLSTQYPIFVIDEINSLPRANAP